ncbi:MAG: polysaccharide deacetylase family protein [Acidobacteria bacterium]|nr:polysaccharide deacetylase family protein [Acidobacteriota bacterium]
MSSILLALIVGSWAARDRATGSADRLLLLLPDGTSFSDPRVGVWLDAASEEGLHVVPVHDSEFVRPLFGVTQCAGIILPDTIHRAAGDVFLESIRTFVGSGGRLMLVYDAGTLSLAGRYAAKWSRLSDLVGVDYALYDALGDGTILWDAPRFTHDLVQHLDIPPGKYYPLRAHAVAAPGRSVGSFSATAGTEYHLTRYKFGEDLKYPSFVTAGDYSGRVLFRSAAGIVAGEHSYGRGSVLFVNLPLGYLKGNTDGLPLHVFLKYFAAQLLSLPYLASVPDGVGGLVLNWHVDSNAALKPLQQLESWTLSQQGPYTIHVTAGPDDVFLGDNKGFDLDRNPLSQELIRRYLGMGQEIGSHGGWAHDYFATRMGAGDRDNLVGLLSLNKQAVERVTGKPVRSYSAPTGNHPAWVTDWLEAHGFVAYYFTGDTGMGPTQGYQDGVRNGQNIWAFPTVHLDRAAAFEEMAREGYRNSEINDWLGALTEFAVKHRTVRLVYFHPPGILDYHDTIDSWMRQTGQLRQEGVFRWYTMAGLADFLNARKQIRWKTVRRADRLTVEAIHPSTLAHAAWLVPAGRYSEPVITSGAADVRREHDDWIVVAKEGKEMHFETQLVSNP